MKKFILMAVLVGVVAALLASTALAAGPATPTAQGFGPGNGMRTQNNGQATQDTDSPCGMAAGAAGMMRRGAAAGGAPEWARQPEEVATLLGMSAEEIQAERQAGKSLEQIAAAKGISKDTLISTILDAKQAQLAQLVADGKLTQAQMDLMVEHMQTQVQTMVERTTVGPAFGQGQTRPGMRQGQTRPNGMMGQGFRGGRGVNR